MRRRIVFTLLATLSILGLWQTGHGIWIYLKADLAQYLLERAWGRTLKGEQQVKPWPWADTWPIARMQVPKHGVDLIILSGANPRILAFGPGHEPISAPPGENGTSILSGHRDTHFRFLELAKAGEQILIQQPNGLITPYDIKEINIVDARHTHIHLPLALNYLVLVTCYPFDAIIPGGSLRYVVTALANEPDIDYWNLPPPPHRFSHL